jgi:hypothetical protein
MLLMCSRRNSTKKLNEVGQTLQKELLSNDLPSEFVQWRWIAAVRYLLRAVCGSKWPSATKEIPAFNG